MRHIYKNMLLILKSSITGEKYSLLEPIDLEEILKVSHEHSIIPLVFVGVSNCGIKLENPIIQRMFQEYCQYIRQHEQQMFELKRLYNAFDEKGIRYMPVKGCNMKDLYPHPEMRVMGDADILIDTRQYSDIEKILSNLEFEFVSKGDHDYTWISPSLHLELHYELMYAYNKEYEKYFGNGWKLAKIQKGYKYSMTFEDEFIYLFVHFTKHYRISGIGCRHVVDLWVYLINHKNLNFEYIEKVMHSLSIYRFYKNTMNLINVWFNGKKEDEISEYMTEYVFNSGSWGSSERRIETKALEIKQNEEISWKGRIKSLFKIIFPPLEVMQKKYKILYTKGYLLPFMWIRKWIEAIILRPQNVIAAKKEMEIILKDELSECEKSLDKVGLNFTFEEKK